MSGQINETCICVAAVGPTLFSSFFVLLSPLRAAHANNMVDTLRKQDRSGRKQNRSGRKQNRSGRKQDRSGRKQDRLRRKQDRSRRKQDRSGCKQDRLGRKQDRSGRKCELELARGKKQQGTFVNGTFVNGSEPRTIAQRLHVPQRDLEDHSHTAGCPKCDFIISHGNKKDAHNYNDSETCGVSTI